MITRLQDGIVEIREDPAANETQKDIHVDRVAFFIKVIKKRNFNFQLWR